MKKILLITMYLLAIQSVAGQMDSRFYYPSKEWAGIDSLDYREIMVPVDGDTLMTVLISPTQDVKATILYFHGMGVIFQHILMVSSLWFVMVFRCL